MRELGERGRGKGEGCQQFKSNSCNFPCKISIAGHYTSSQHQQVSLFASVIKLWVILRPCIIFWVEMRD